MFQGNSKTRNFIFLFFILVAATIYYFFYSQPGSTLTFSDENTTITLRGPKDTSCSIAISDITSITLEEDPELGEAAGGGSVFQNLYGTWESSTLGTYQAYLTTRIPSCVVISTDQLTAAFNYSNQETTASLYEELTSYWTSHR